MMVTIPVGKQWIKSINKVNKNFINNKDSNKTLWQDRILRCGHGEQNIPILLLCQFTFTDDYLVFS